MKMKVLGASEDAISVSAHMKDRFCIVHTLVVEAVIRLVLSAAGVSVFIVGISYVNLLFFDFFSFFLNIFNYLYFITP